MRNARGGPHPGSRACGADRDRGRRRRNHRASARGSPAHPRRGHCAAEGGDREAAQSRDGGNRRDGADRGCNTARTPLASCRNGARSARPKAASTWPASMRRFAAVVGRSAGGRDPRLAVHRRRAAPDRGSRRVGAPVDRDSHRRVVRCACRQTDVGAAGGVGADSCTARSSPERLGLEVHAGHGLNFATAEAIAALPEIVELNIGHFLIGEAVYLRPCSCREDACARPWTGARA